MAGTGFRPPADHRLRGAIPRTGTDRLEIMGTQRYKPGSHHNQPPGEHDPRGAGQRNLPGGDRTLVRDRNRPDLGPSGQHNRRLRQCHRRRNSRVHRNTIQRNVRQHQGETPMDRGLRRRRNANHTDTRADHRPDGGPDTPGQHRRRRAGHGADTTGRRPTG